MEIIQLPSKSEKVVRVRFNGVIYRRYPFAKKSSDRNYFRCSMGDKRRGFTSLHRDLWIHHRGPIPEGHDVHHSNHDPLDTRIENLECLSEAEHHARHHDEASRRSREKMLNLTAEERQRMDDGARAWHGSAEGHAWHSDNAKRMWAARRPDEYDCDFCGKRYQTKKRGNTRFCSLKCKAAQRRKDGVDDVDRTCARCGGPFRANRYVKRKYCGAACPGNQGRVRQPVGVQSDG